MIPHYLQTCLQSCLRRRALSFLALLSTLMVMLVGYPAWAQTPVPSREHAKSTECIRVHDPDLHFVDEETKAEKHFAVVSFSKDAPNCGIRNAYRMFPILDEDGKPLSIQDWLRSVYAANQEGKHPTMRRGCDPRSPATADATIEEQKYCAGHYVNYFGIESNGWRAIINIPRTRWYTFFEQQAAVAANACTELEKIPNPTPEATKTLAECRKAHSIGTPLAPPQTTVCGNGQVEAGEQCDDGNATSGDGCSATCRTETPDPSTLQKMLDEAKAKVAALTERVTQLETALQAATAFRPFKPNAWLFVALVMALAFGFVATRQTKGRRQLMDELVASGKREQDLSIQLEKALVKVLNFAELETQNGMLTSRTKLLEEAAKKVESEKSAASKMFKDKLEEQDSNHKAAIQAMNKKFTEAAAKYEADLKDKVADAVMKRDKKWGDQLRLEKQEMRERLANELSELRAQVTSKDAELVVMLEELEHASDKARDLSVQLSRYVTIIRQNEEYSFYLLAWIMERDPEQANRFELTPGIEARLQCHREDIRDLLREDAEMRRPSMAPPPFLPEAEPVSTSTPTTETTPTPTTETYSAPIYAPTPKGTSYRKTTMEFPPVRVPAPVAEVPRVESPKSPAEIENDMLRGGLMNAIEILEEGGSKIVDGAGSEDLVKHALVVASAVKLQMDDALRAKDVAETQSRTVFERWENEQKRQAADPSGSGSPEPTPPRSGYEISSLEELQGVELVWYMRNIFSEVWRRIRKYGEQFEMELVSREDVRIC